MLYKSLFQLYPDNIQNNYFLLSDKLEDIRYIILNEECRRTRLTGLENAEYNKHSLISAVRTCDEYNYATPFFAYLFIHYAMHTCRNTLHMHAWETINTIT